MDGLANVGTWLNLGGAALVVGLGLLVATVRPRTRVTLSFAAFAVLFGAQFVLTNLGTFFHLLSEPWIFARAAVRLAAVAALGAFALVFPSPVAPQDRLRLLALPAALLVGVTASGLLAPTNEIDAIGGPVNRTSFSAVLGALGAFLVLLALRYPDLPPDDRRQVALTASALLLYLGFVAGAGPDSNRGQTLLADGGPNPAAIVRFAAVALIAVLFLRASARTEGPAARNVALVALLLPTVGLAYLATGFGEGGPGLTRTVMVGVLSYAIVRHRLLGLDVKLRWTISKSTVAAVFVAAFFVASEGAQVLFGAENPYVGVAAAGALVFAIAPLQRAADRLAERAVPLAPAGALAPDRREQAYRVALRKFLRDGRLTREEELALAELATALGITPVRAVELRHEVAG